MNGRIDFSEVGRYPPAAGRKPAPEVGRYPRAETVSSRYKTVTAAVFLSKLTSLVVKAVIGWSAGGGDTRESIESNQCGTIRIEIKSACCDRIRRPEPYIGPSI